MYWGTLAFLGWGKGCGAGGVVSFCFCFWIAYMYLTHFPATGCTVMEEASGCRCEELAVKTEMQNLLTSVISPRPSRSSNLEAGK
jgi:hypothetical protein